MAFQYVLVKNSGRGRGYLPTIMPEASELWEYFFRRVSLLTPENALRSAQVVRASTNHMRLNQYTQNPYQRELFDRVLGWLQSYNQGDFHGIIRMNPSVEYGILKHVQATLGSDKNVLGVMCRGTDFSSEFTPRNASPEDMIAATRYYLRKYPIEHIFLATEDEKIYQQFSEAFPGKILSIQQKRVCYDYEKQPWEFVANLLALKDGRAFGLTYLSVLYALSRCRYLIVSMDCGATRGAWALAERPFDVYENINKTKLLQLLFEEKIEEAEKKAGRPVLLYQLHRSEEGWNHWNIEDRSSLGGDSILSRRLRYDFLKGRSMCVTRHIILREDGANAA